MFERPLLDTGVPLGAKTPAFRCSDALVVPQNTGARGVCGLGCLYLKAGTWGWGSRPGQAHLCTSSVMGRRKVKRKLLTANQFLQFERLVFSVTLVEVGSFMVYFLFFTDGHGSICHLLSVIFLKEAFDGEVQRKKGIAYSIISVGKRMNLAMHLLSKTKVQMRRSQYGSK